MAKSKSKAADGNGAKGVSGDKPQLRRAQKRLPELPESLKKLTLRAFQKTYDAHHGKTS